MERILESTGEDMKLGSLEQLDDGRYQLRFTRTLPHPIERVWRAITEPEHLAHWFPTTIEGERSAGSPLRFSFPGGQAPPFDGEMLTYDPQALLRFQWGPDTVRLELRSTPTTRGGCMSASALHSAA